MRVTAELPYRRGFAVAMVACLGKVVAKEIAILTGNAHNRLAKCVATGVDGLNLARVALHVEQDPVPKPDRAMEEK